ncbi:ferritin family protein [Desulfurispora thermophila]|uniref:ferritin family protein n=1 Tax=Desulfurispora thermophila TaxID=265470 RepID=UPI000365671B|nr:ferritin-like domain-containing protein [Desulfurispora thermophila]
MNCTNLAEMLLEAYQDERKADAFYSNLLAMADNDFEAVDALAEARRDERRHACQIAELYKELTGQLPPPASPYPPQADSLIEGIRLAIADEEHAIEFYKKIADCTSNPVVVSTMLRIREDETVHALKFRALLAELEEEAAEEPEPATTAPAPCDPPVII